MKACVNRLIAAAFLIVAVWLPTYAVADTARVALVIGNGGYDASIGHLRNPANDAALMAQTLKRLGFAVTLAIDVDQKGMKRHIRDFGQALRASGPTGIGLFYYAGHGLQVNGENYLLPIGAQIEAEGDVELEAISAASVLAQMQYAHNSVNLVFLDACRNNPLSRGFRSAQRGLARVDAPRGSFIGYSTAPGEVSVDGSGENSPYTMALAEEMLHPGAAIEEVHRAVRLKVLAATDEQQTPWDSSSLTATVTLAGAQAARTPAPAPAAAAEASAPNPAANQKAEMLFWESAMASNNPAVFQAYLKQFPNGMFAALARAKLEDLAAVTPAPAPAQIKAAPATVPAVARGTADIIEMQGDFVATGNANIRAEPDSGARILGKLKGNETVAVTGRTPDSVWLQVASADGPGYVSAKLLRPVPEAPVPEASVRTTAPVPEPVPPAAPLPAAPLPAAQAPRDNVLRISESLRPEIERYLANSAKQTGNYRFLAVNAAGDKLGLSTACKILKTSWGGWAAEGCGDEAAARRLAVDICGSDCRVIFKGAEKIGRFDIEWVMSDGSVEPAADDDAAAQAPAPAAIRAPEPDNAVQAASAVPAGDSAVIRISESLRPDIERYLANSARQTGNYRFLAVNAAGDKLGLSTACKIQKTSWGGWAAEGCGDEAAARRLAVDTCGSDCRVIFKGAEKVGRFDIEWY